MFIAAFAGTPMGAQSQAPPPQGPPPPPPPSPTQDLGPAQFGTGAISGVVTDGVTGQPVDGALVMLSAGAARGGAGARPRQRTDARGRFLFHRLPAFESYVVQVSRQGYFDAGFKGTPGSAVGSRIPLRDGEWFAKANVSLWKPAAITGTVRDERGEPVVGVAVRAILQVQIAGHLKLAAGPSAVTDDRGAYRLANLKAGRYVVHMPSVQITLPDGTPPLAGARQVSGATGAPPPPDPLTLLRSDDAGRSDGLSVLVGHYPTPSNLATAYPMMYHPAARTLDQAETISVNYAELKANIDVTLAPTSTVRVSGQVVGPADVIAKLPVRLLPDGAEDIGEGGEAALTLTDALGRFTFLQVPSGAYTLVASSAQAEYGTGSSSGGRLMPPLPGLQAVSMSSGPVASADGLRYSSRRTSRTGATGRVAVAVGDQNLDDVSVPIQSGVTVSGYFLWDGSQSPPEGLRFVPLVRLEPADGNLSTGMPFGGSLGSPNALPTPVAFQLEGVLPGRYVFGESLGSAAGFTVEAVEHAGVDLMTTPLVVAGEKEIRDVVVRMVSKPLILSGRVSLANGTAPENAAVAFFPTERTAWRDYGISAVRFKSTQVMTAGTFILPPGLPPGEYYAATIRQDERHRWITPEFLKTIVVRATRFRLAPGAPVTLDLRFDEGGR